jgi:hypothetical protein
VTTLAGLWLHFLRLSIDASSTIQPSTINHFKPATGHRRELAIDNLSEKKEPRPQITRHHSRNDIMASIDTAAIDAERAKCGFIYRESVTTGLKIEMELKRLMISTQSEFQQIDVIETYFGKVRL